MTPSSFLMARSEAPSAGTINTTTFSPRSLSSRPTAAQAVTFLQVKVMSSMFMAEEKFVKRQPLRLSKKTLPPQDLSIHKLLKSFLAAITTEEELILPEVLVSSEEFHVKDKINIICSQLENLNKIKLSEVIETDSAGEIVATFLALLELIKRQKVKADQLIPFAEILISKVNI